MPSIGSTYHVRPLGLGDRCAVALALDGQRRRLKPLQRELSGAPRDVDRDLEDIAVDDGAFGRLVLDCFAFDGHRRSLATGWARKECARAGHVRRVIGAALDDAAFEQRDTRHA